MKLRAYKKTYDPWKRPPQKMRLQKKPQATQRDNTGIES
jgi:hypothetical protein